MREVWNARGAADIAQINERLSTLLGESADGVYAKHLGLDLELLKLDR